MKSFILLLIIFIAGVFYLIKQHKVDLRQEAAVQQEKENLIRSSEPVLPLKPENPALNISIQTHMALRTLARDGDEKNRSAAAELLWRIQDDQAAAVIKRMLQEETDETVKSTLIGILAQDKSKLGLALLSEAMKSYDKGTRLKAVSALGTFSNTEAITALNTGLKDYDNNIRLKSQEAIQSVRNNIEAYRKQQILELKDSKSLFKLNY